jgi:4-diphosphocytidyl-2-C-methyl-D-erythritol kinase
LADRALEAFAPAKVNLFLHVGAPRADGFHPISSLMVFADIGDVIHAERASRFSLEIDGPFASHAPAGADNLVVRAVRALRQGEDGPPLRLTLSKLLPAAAGLGGGSSDAAAALRLCSEALGLGLGPERLHEIAASLGSDVPACLEARPVLAEGRGELLSAAPQMAPVPAVLARPAAGSATGPVYRAFDEGLAARIEQDLRPTLPDRIDGPAALAQVLAVTRNDLEAPAVALEPAIGQVLDALRGAPEALFARMSGSGSACFAICPRENAAGALAARLQAARPDWWVKACRLGGPWARARL